MNALVSGKQNRNAAMQIIARTGRSEVEKHMREYQIDNDALWLLAVAKETGYGLKRLRRLYEAFYKLRKDEKEFFESTGYDGVLETSARTQLSDAGINIEQWFTEVGEMLVSTEFEAQTFREQKSKALERVSERNANRRINPRKVGEEFTVAKCGKCGEWYEPICELPHICQLQNSYDLSE